MCDKLRDKDGKSCGLNNWRRGGDSNMGILRFATVCSGSAYKLLKMFALDRELRTTGDARKVPGGTSKMS